MSLLSSFSDLDSSVRDALAEISSPLLLAFAALDIAANEVQVERLTAALVRYANLTYGS